MNYDPRVHHRNDKALAEAADWGGASTSASRARRGKQAQRPGHRLLSEVTGPPAKEYGGIRFEADGTVTMPSGTLDYGQGKYMHRSRRC